MGDNIVLILKALFRDLSLASTAMCLIPASAYAEDPINRCMDAGGSTSTATNGAPAESFTRRDSKPSPMQNLLAADPSLGIVDLKTGGLVLEHEDIAVGQGSFPQRLSLERIYRSDADGPETVSLTPYKPNAKQWLAFGRSGTHNLDIRFTTGAASFGGKLYVMTYVRRGLTTSAFQSCSDGTMRNSSQDGTRLFVDSTYGTGGIRFEDRDGTKIYFQKLTASQPKRYCNNNNNCGYARKIVSPNGDWIELNYEQYDSHPSNTPQVGHTAPWLMSTFATTQVCKLNWQQVQECKYQNTPNYLVRNDGQVSAVGNNPVIDVRLTNAVNSRGYKFTFSYVNPTTSGLYLCSPVGSNLSCSGSGNENLDRNRLSLISASWVSSSGTASPLGQVSYAYKSRRSNWPYQEYLASYTDLSQATWQYDNDSNIFRVYRPGDTSPSSSVTFDTGYAGYYYPEIDQSNPFNIPQRTTSYYDRVRTQSFGSGETINFDPAVQGKWTEEAYGTFDWKEVISQMTTTVSGTSVTKYDYFDGQGEHNRSVKITDPLSKVTINAYDPSGSLVSTINPEGDSTSYAYDIRGNLLSRTFAPKTGSALAPIVEQWSYVGGPTLAAESCANQNTCNNRITYRDFKNGQTDYSWDLTSGLILQIQGPTAPDGLRPTKDYTYYSLTVGGSTSVYSLATEATKIDSASSNLIQFEYGDDIRRVLKGKIESAGGSSLRTCYGYDLSGDRIFETSPRAGLTSCN